MERSSKKRKRSSNDNIVSNKKVAINGSAADRIKIQLQDTKGLQPVLVSSSGLRTPDIPFTPFAKSAITGNDNEALPRPSTHNLLLHSSQHLRLDYSASSVNAGQSLSHYVGVFDPTTNKLQITPAYSLDLRTALRSIPKDEAEQKGSLGQQREELGRQFGTKKAKKAIASKTVNAIKKDTSGKSSVQDAILESMKGSAIPALSEQEALEAALQAKPIPTPDLSAQNVEDVYSFATLIPSDDSRLVTVKDWQENARGEVEMKFNHRFPANRVETIGKSDDVQRLKALKYLTLLLDFHGALQNAGRSGKKIPKKEVLQKKLAAWPEALTDSVRRRFANQQNELPKWYMDNLCTHICALSLYVDGWTTETTDLKNDLRMETREVVGYFRELGCKAAAPTEKEKESLYRKIKDADTKKKVASAARVAKLKLPLDFPKARSGRKK